MPAPNLRGKHSAIVYFFPELALSTLRAFKAYQSPEGATAFMFSGFSYHTPPCGMVSATPGWQTATNAPQYVDIVNRYWNCTGDDEMLKEFYESVKKTTIYTMNLRPDLGPDGIISVAHEQNASILGFAPGFGTDWIEMCEYHGMTAHVAGIHLAHLKMAERMAEEMGDTEFADQCRDWFAQGSNSLEDQTVDRRLLLELFRAHNRQEVRPNPCLPVGWRVDGKGLKV